MTPHRTPDTPRGRPLRTRLGLSLTLLAATALLSSGFVRGRIDQRRSRRGRLMSRLELEAATERRAIRPSRFHSRRQRRRDRGRGWSAGPSIELLQQHYAFGAGGKHVTRSLSQSAIQATMSRYNQQLGSCLLQHGASDLTIKLQIESTGRVSAVTTNLAGAAARCVKSIVLQVRFPASKSTKTTGSYQLRMR